MPRFFNRLPGQALRIGIGARAVSLLRTSRWGGAGAEVLAEQAYALEDAGVHQAHHAVGAALRAMLGGAAVPGGLARWPLAVVLADEFARIWQVTPPRQAARLADLEAAASLRFLGLYGESPAGWAIAADWNAGAPFLAAAIPRPLQAMLVAVAQESALALVQVQPHFVAAWNRWHGAIKPGAWFGAVHDGMLTLAVIDGRRLHAARALALPDGAAGLAQALQREALLAGVDVPALVQLCGDVPPCLRAAALGATQCVVLGEPRPGEQHWSAASLLARGAAA